MAAGYKAVPMSEISEPFHYNKYQNSRIMRINPRHDKIRKLTFNGYLLPAGRTRIVSMAQSTPYSVWRAKKVVYYDVTSNKAFECERSWITTFFLVLGLNIEIDLKYDKAKKDFQKNGDKLKNIKFWKKYLELDK